MNVREIIKLGMESLPMSDLNEETYHSFLHEIKNMAIDMNNIKQKGEELTTDQRIDRLEERMNILLLENAKLKLILEDICHEVSKEQNLNHKTRRKS
jgi:hypothetical protein